MTAAVDLLDQRVPHRAAALTAATLQHAKSGVVMATAGSDSRIAVLSMAAAGSSAAGVQTIALKDSCIVKCIALGPKASHVLVGCADGSAHLANTANGHFF